MIFQGFLGIFWVGVIKNKCSAIKMDSNMDFQGFDVLPPDLFTDLFHLPNIPSSFQGPEFLMEILILLRLTGKKQL